MTDNKKISLTVQHAYSNESGYAFFSSDDRGKLGISAGDYVKISGGKTALARAHFHPDVHPGKIVLNQFSISDGVVPKAENLSRISSNFSRPM